LGLLIVVSQDPMQFSLPLFSIIQASSCCSCSCVFLLSWAVATRILCRWLPPCWLDVLTRSLFLFCHAQLMMIAVAMRFTLNARTTTAVAPAQVKRNVFCALSVALCLAWRQ
jgi:hypothetical protein